MSVKIYPVQPAEIKCTDYTVKINGREGTPDTPVAKSDDEQHKLGKHTETYSELDKNTVDSKNQLKPSGTVCLVTPAVGGKRILVVGNSITRHGIAPHIGWYGEWGMAASGEQNDFVHKLASMAKGNTFCICQVAAWEREYKNGTALLPRYQAARDFDADIIVMRFLENCPKDGFDNALFKSRLDSLLSFLNKSGNAKIIMSTSFWHHPGDGAVIEYATENNYPCVTLGDLGQRDEMKAIGLFDHNGVANHPGDVGMEHIAKRLYAELERLI